MNKNGQYPRRPTQSGTVPLFVEQFQKKWNWSTFCEKMWNCSTFFGLRDPKTEQLYEKVEKVLKAGHSSTKCGAAPINGSISPCLILLFTFYLFLKTA
jgi:hypothetical protein